MEYHIITIPYFPWTTYDPKSLEALVKLTHWINTFFRFEVNENGKIERSNHIMVETAASMELTSTTSTPRTLLSYRLPQVLDVMENVKDITEIVRESAPKEFNILKVEEVYETEYALEIISSSLDTMLFGNELYLDMLLGKLSNNLYTIDKQFSHATRILTCKIILCDNLSELKSIASKYELEGLNETLYIGSEKTLDGLRTKMFRFIREPWNRIYILNPLACLKPEAFEREYCQQKDELAFFLSLIYSLGKTYMILSSCRQVVAVLEGLPWYIDDVLEKFELEFCWIKRYFYTVEKDLHKVKKKIELNILPFIKMSTSLESIELLEDIYGFEYFHEIKSLLRTLSTPLLQEYMERFNIHGDELVKAILKELKFLSRRLTSVFKEFTEAFNYWREYRRSKIMINQLRLALASILLTLIINILLRML
jgi:hypothetical protein